MSDKTAISTTDAPAPMPVFSQGVRKGNILQVSGQGSVDPSGEFVFTGDVKGQTTRVLQNIEAILKAGGAQHRRRGDAARLPRPPATTSPP